MKLRLRKFAPLALTVLAAAGLVGFGGARPQGKPVEVPTADVPALFPAPVNLAIGELEAVNRSVARARAFVAAVGRGDQKAADSMSDAVPRMPGREPVLIASDVPELRKRWTLARFVVGRVVYRGPEVWGGGPYVVPYVSVRFRAAGASDARTLTILCDPASDHVIAVQEGEVPPR